MFRVRSGSIWRILDYVVNSNHYSTQLDVSNWDIHQAKSDGTDCGWLGQYAPCFILCGYGTQWSRCRINPLAHWRASCVGSRQSLLHCNFLAWTVLHINCGFHFRKAIYKYWIPARANSKEWIQALRCWRWLVCQIGGRGNES